MCFRAAFSRLSGRPKSPWPHDKRYGWGGDGIEPSQSLSSEAPSTPSAFGGGGGGGGGSEKPSIWDRRRRFTPPGAFSADEIGSNNIPSGGPPRAERKRRFSMEDNPVIGIDLGTSYCCVAVFRDIDKIEIVPNELGFRITPSYVSFTPQGERLVGDAAKKHGMRFPQECIFEVKRLMGRSFVDPTVQRDSKTWPFQVSPGPRGEVVLQLPPSEASPDKQSSFHPEEISAMLLAKMKTIAEEFTNCKPITDCVITVPAYFNDSRRKATMDAGIAAGLNVLRLMSEPTAAALAYGHQRLIGRGPGAKKVLVFDLGGGTFDVSIITVEIPTEEDSSFWVNAVAGHAHLGGADIDNRLLHHVAEQFNGQLGGKEDLLDNSKVLPKLKQAILEAKHTLSVQTETDISLDYRDGWLSMTLTRAEFEMINKDIFDRCLIIVQQALRCAQISKDEIADVVLAGGSTRIPIVQEMLTSFFGKPPVKAINPDEAVAFGAALQAGLLARSGRCVAEGWGSPPLSPLITVRDVTPLSVGVETTFGVMRVVIPRNTPIPATGEMAYRLGDFQETLEVYLYEGERAMCHHNRLLGQLTLTGFTPAPANDQAAVRVVLTVDADGILHAMAEATANHSKQGTKVEVEVQTLRSTLDRDGVHAMAAAVTGLMDCYTPEAEAEDAEIWATKKSRNALCELVLSLRRRQPPSSSPPDTNNGNHNTGEDCVGREREDLEQTLDQVWSWMMAQEELESKQEYDKRFADLQLLAG